MAIELGLSRPAVSRQLRLLREAGLIEWRAYSGDRRAISYHLARERLAPIIAWLAGTEVGLGTPIVLSDTRDSPVRSDRDAVVAPEADETTIVGRPRGDRFV